jgi:hypothetical protein
MDNWLSLSPTAAFLLGGALVLLGMLAGRYTRGRRAGGPREEAGRDATVQDIPNQVAEHEEASTSRAEQMSLHEWDGGPPRPNWNRWRNLNIMG